MEFVTDIVKVLALVIVAGGLATVIAGLLKKKPYADKMSFKETLDLTDLPILTFLVGDKKLNFILDTGASNSYIHQGILGDIEHTDLGVEGTVYGMEGNRVETGCATIVLKYKDTEFSDDFQVFDLSQPLANLKETHGVNVHGFLGNSFFQKYRYIIDFDELVAYPSR